MRARTIRDEEPLVNYAKASANELHADFARYEANFHTDPIEAKIAVTGRAKAHTILVIGARDMDAGAVSVRLHGKGPQGAKPRGEVVANMLTAIRERQA